ncbi:hypothetical protein [Fusibacter ferrireducens]|uniref:Uncharacterized protein n=1 Tax=Fusibacter ferrireducens TaxID=2785058 RepID=A0ABR9ZNE5_9FIRM|nr:hypothetical protein [Fusibacter ferrireducens]MBF4691929.1 hypothetical protein [Fusibacter ferrireducens]
MKKLEVTQTLLIAFAVLFFILYLSSNAALKEARALNASLNEDLLMQKNQYTSEIDKLNTTVVNLKTLIDKRKEEYDTLHESYHKLVMQLPVIADFELSLIEKEGITEPRAITTDLMNHFELIPYDGVLGGTMMFTQVYLLNDQWVFARFEDGHIMGSAIYQYEISSDQSIQWKLIKSMLY